MRYAQDRGRYDPSEAAPLFLSDETSDGSTLRSGLAIIAVVLIAALFNGLMSVPRLGPDAETGVGALAPSILLAGLLLPVLLGLGWRWLLWILSFALAAVTVLRLIDAGYSAFYGRPIDLTTDGQVLPRVVTTLVQGFPVKGTLMVVGMIVAAIVLLVLARTLTGGLAWLVAERGRAPVFLGAVTLAGGAMVAASVFGAPLWQARAAKTITNQVTGAIEYRDSRDEIMRAITSDPLTGDAAVLGGANVHLLFIESYGSFLFDDKMHTEEFAPTVTDLEERLERGGYHAVTRTVDAPIIGGRSWLSHGTVLSGVTLKNEAYNAELQSSDRRTLVDVFKDGGYETVAVGPSVRRTWTENGFFHFDAVLNFWDLKYNGPGYGLLEIPDQIVLKQIETLVVEKTDKPLFLVVPLVSSHWPWEVVPRFIEDWSKLDHGESLEMMPEQAVAGKDDVEREFPPVYIATIAYSLKSAAQYAVEATGDDDLVLLIGDHPPAPFVTDDRRGRGVPVHILSRNKDRLARFIELGFIEGLTPPLDPATELMSRLPHWLLGGEALTR